MAKRGRKSLMETDPDKVAEIIARDMLGQSRRGNVMAVKKGKPTIDKYAVAKREIALQDNVISEKVGQLYNTLGQRFLKHLMWNLDTLDKDEYLRCHPESRVRMIDLLHKQLRLAQGQPTTITSAPSAKELAILLGLKVEVEVSPSNPAKMLEKGELDSTEKTIILVPEKATDES